MLTSLTPHLGLGKNFMQFGMKATAHMFSYGLLVLLMGAWIFTGPVLRLLDDIIYAAKQFTGRGKTKGRSENQGTATKMAMAMARHGSAVRMPA
jgi:hypothetical protein